MRDPTSRGRFEAMLDKFTARYPLTRLARISLAAALATIAIKTLAWALTDSVGFVSDAAESGVNLAAAVMALLILHWVARPPDAEHTYGHEKAEYFSASGQPLTTRVDSGPLRASVY